MTLAGVNSDTPARLPSSFTPEMNALRLALETRTGRQWVVWRLLTDPNTILVAPPANRHHADQEVCELADDHRVMLEVFGPYKHHVKIAHAEIETYIDRATRR